MTLELGDSNEMMVQAMLAVGCTVHTSFLFSSSFSSLSLSVFFFFFGLGISMEWGSDCEGGL